MVYYLRSLLNSTKKSFLSEVTIHCVRIQFNFEQVNMQKRAQNGIYLFHLIIKLKRLKFYFLAG